MWILGNSFYICWHLSTILIPVYFLRVFGSTIHAISWGFKNLRPHHFLWSYYCYFIICYINGSYLFSIYLNRCIYNSLIFVDDTPNMVPRVLFEAYCMLSVEVTSFPYLILMILSIYWSVKCLTIYYVMSIINIELRVCKI